MTRTEQKRTKGRQRCINETMALELLCERPTLSLYEAAEALRRPRSFTYCVLWRLWEQRLVVCIEHGRRGRNAKPSVWQLRETFERLHN